MVLVKAYGRKKAGMKKLSWKDLIDEYGDDEVGMTVRMLMDNRLVTTNTARVEAFCEITGADRATFYRRMKHIKAYRPDKEGSAWHPETQGTATPGSAS